MNGHGSEGICCCKRIATNGYLQIPTNTKVGNHGFKISNPFKEVFVGWDEMEMEMKTDGGLMAFVNA